MSEFYKSGNKADINKLELMLLELEEHPKIGIGNPEQLKHKLSGTWSRRINSKDRLIYIIKEHEIIVLILSARGHYSNK